MTRLEEKKLCAELASAATTLTQPGLNYAELYMARLQLAQAIRTLLEADMAIGNRAGVRA